ncbi:hypothetical protein [Methylomonas sp. MgM2]
MAYTIRKTNVRVKIPGAGFGGVGRVTGRSQPTVTFTITTANGEVPILGVAKRGNYHKEYVFDPERCDYFVPIKCRKPKYCLQAYDTKTAFNY